MARILSGRATENDKERLRAYGEQRLAEALAERGLVGNEREALALRDAIVTDGTDAAGAVILPVEVADVVMSTVYTSPMLNPDTVTFTPNFDGILRTPQVDATSPPATTQGQDTAAPEGTFTFNKMELHAVPYTTPVIPISRQALREGGAIVTNALAQWFGQGFLHALGHDATFGDGNDKMSGVLHGLVVSGGSDATLRRIVQVTTADTPLYADVVGLLDSKLDVVYQNMPKTCMLMHRTFAGAVAELRTTNGDRYWDEWNNLMGGSYPTIRGQKVRWHNLLQSGLAADTDIPCFVMDGAYFLVVQSPGGWMVATDDAKGSKFDKQQTQLIGYTEVDSARSNNYAVAALQNKA